eukprot:1185469-Prorocentrum_minimum.AAC.1
MVRTRARNPKILVAGHRQGEAEDALRLVKGRIQEAVRWQPTLRRSRCPLSRRSADPVHRNLSSQGELRDARLRVTKPAPSEEFLLARSRVYTTISPRPGVRNGGRIRLAQRSTVAVDFKKEVVDSSIIASVQSNRVCRPACGEFKRCNIMYECVAAQTQLKVKKCEIPLCGLSTTTRGLRERSGWARISSLACPIVRSADLLSAMPGIC